MDVAGSTRYVPFPVIPATSAEPPPNGTSFDTPLRMSVQGIGIEFVAPLPVLAGFRDRLGDSATASRSEVDPTVRYRLVGIDDRGVHIAGSDGLTVTGPDIDGTLDSLTDHVHDMVANRSTAGLFVHAAAFAIANRLVIVPGRSQSGKSSLVACAVARGATYFSDEYAIIDGTAMVHPYPRPISLRTTSGASLRHVERDLGGRSAGSAARVSLVLVTNYEPGATWKPQALVGSRAALPIIANTIHARRLAESTMRLAGRIAGEALVLEGPRGEASSMVAELEELVRSLPEPMAEPAHGGRA